MSDAAVNTVTVTIEGRTVTVPAGTPLIEAAKVAGVLIPHYCYHPGLPVAGVCRMCLVEVEKFPKLAPACATAVADGQVVHVHSEKAKQAREGVLEFLLINHPLDCPVCDQAGECELQDYTFQEGRAESRYQEPKRFNPVEDFGGDVLYVPNRCILCTRCVRFMDQVAHDPVLNVSERGDRAFIGKAPGEDLTHPWSGNVVDLCPVGALLSKDFLNKARAWELDRAPSVCTGCSQGCSNVVETRDNTVVRLKPRPNDQVNQYYLCDEGRLDYRWINRRDRLDQPMVRRGDELVLSDWEEALDAAAAGIAHARAAGGRVVIVASPDASNETLFLARRVQASADDPALMHVSQGPEAPLAGVPDLALRAERAANATGARLFGYRDVDAVGTEIGRDDVVLVLDETLRRAGREGFGASLADALARAHDVIVLGTVVPAPIARRATIALPIANHTEEEGTFTNLRGLVQRFRQARVAPGRARSSWRVLGELVERVHGDAAPASAADAFAAITASHEAFAGLTWRGLGMRGRRAAIDAAALTASSTGASA